MTKRIARAVALSALTITLGTAGCGAEEKTPGVASVVGTTTTTAAAATDVVAEYVEAQRKYAKCLREAGWDVSDPDAKGKIDFRLGDGRLKTDPKFQTAQRKCDSLSRPVPDELNPPPPPRSAEEIAKAREYAKCMRENGVPHFSDPDERGYFSENQGPEPTQITDQQAAVEGRAFDKCAPIIGAATTGPGQG